MWNPNVRAHTVKFGGLTQDSSNECDCVGERAVMSIATGVVGVAVEGIPRDQTCGRREAWGLALARAAGGMDGNDFSGRERTAVNGGFVDDAVESGEIIPTSSDSQRAVVAKAI